MEYLGWAIFIALLVVIIWANIRAKADNDCSSFKNEEDDYNG